MNVSSAVSALLLVAAAALTPTAGLAQSAPENGSRSIPEPARLDVPFVPTRQQVVDAMLDLAGVRPTDVLYDLGCGDGRIVVTAASKYGARAVGVDIDPQRIEEATQNARRAGVAARTSFRVGDLFDADIKDATVVTLYLLPSVNRKLKPRLLRQLEPGTRIVSHDFDMGDDWPAQKAVKLGNDTIYLWTVPKRAGAR